LLSQLHVSFAIAASLFYSVCVKPFAITVVSVPLVELSLDLS
jgi:hypothetical protein